MGCKACLHQIRKRDMGKAQERPKSRLGGLAPKTRLRERLRSQLARSNEVGLKLRSVRFEGRQCLFSKLLMVETIGMRRHPAELGTRLLVPARLLEATGQHQP